MTIHGDGVFILKTLSLSLKDGEYEYRVAYSPDISVIFGKYDDRIYNWIANANGLWNTFKACFLSTNEGAAKAYAEKLAKLHGKETECGILVIHSFQKQTWDHLINS